MSLLRRTRTEVAGAWRSVRYDLDRRVEVRPEEPVPSPVNAPDVTSTGMNTFGGPVVAGLVTGYEDELPRRPRRVLAACVFGGLALVGAAGSYVAVVHGLGAVLERPASAGVHRQPVVAAAPVAPPPATTTGLGRVARPAGMPQPVAPDGTTAPAARPKRAAHTAAGVTPTSPACDCLSPPVPTPTSVPSTTPSPTGSPSPSASDSPAPSASPADTASPSPSATEEPDDHDRQPGRRHRRGH